MFKPSLKVLEKVILGKKFTTNYKIYYKNPETGKLGSFFHDVPMKDNKTNLFNMVIEIPQHTNPKYEVSKTDILNPIVQDTKKGKLRFINNLFPYKGYICSYGCIPQTWEDPALEGDNDPLDVLDISTGKVLNTGDIQQVKVLGSLGLIDDNEIDWKIISISNHSEDFDKINSLEDVEKTYPGLLEGIRFWFANYKVSNKFKNEFLHDGKFLGVQETLKVIEECHNSWKKLISKKKTELKVKDPLIFTETNVNEEFKELLDSKLNEFENSLSKEDQKEIKDFEVDGFDSKWYFRK